MKQSLASEFIRILNIGEEYTLQDIAALMGFEFQAVKGKGVISKKGTDVVFLLITLEKEKSAVQYFDNLVGTTLFWSGQNKQRTVEHYIKEGSHYFFVFCKQKKGLPYVYYGRVLPLRIQESFTHGVPSHFVFDLYDYAEYLKSKTERDVLAESEPKYESPLKETESVSMQKIRIAQSFYRNKALKLWENKCAVTSVDEQGWLIASHIKPWRESTDAEKIDPHNSLVLTPNFDKLFDRGVISFSPSTGKIMLPQQLSKDVWMNLTRLHIDDEVKLRNVPAGVDKYLDYHNKFVFNFKPQDGIETSDFVENLFVKTFS